MGTKYTMQEVRNWRREKDYLFDFSSELKLGNKQKRVNFYYLREEEIIVCETILEEREFRDHSPETYLLAEVSPIINLRSQSGKNPYDLGISSIFKEKAPDQIGFCFYEKELNMLPYYKDNTEAPTEDQPAWYSLDGVGRSSSQSFTIWVENNAESFQAGLRFVNRLFRLLELQMMKEQASKGLEEIKGELKLLESSKPVAWDW